MQWRLQQCGVVDSTNDTLRVLAAQGAPEGTVVVADGQRAGRGRQGRTWLSPSGKNLYGSLLLRPTCPPDGLGPLSLVIGLGVVEGLEEIAAGLSLQIKWPNDIYAANRKLGGILVETLLTDQRVEAVLVGVGININMLATDFPPELQMTATSLRLLTGSDWDLALVRDAVLQGIANAYAHWTRHGFASLRLMYEARSLLEGRRVTAQQADGGKIAGVAQGVTLVGALRVADGVGAIHEICAGDVHVE